MEANSKTMRWRQSHVSDEDFLLLEDGELGPKRRSRVQRHLRACRACAERGRTVQETLQALAGACRDAGEPGPDAHLSRSRLLARLAREPDGPAWASSRVVWPELLQPRGRLAAGGLAAAGLLAALAMWPGKDNAVRPPLDGATRQAAALPRPDLTPGAARQVSVDEVCGRAHAASPLVAASVARQVFENYGADYRRAEKYELDFLITPELGGTADARNLWPQPYGSTRWNAYVKDELESLFRRLVCDGTMDISTAQREMATNWIAAYRRYFDTDRPRRNARRDG